MSKHKNLSVILKSECIQRRVTKTITREKIQLYRDYRNKNKLLYKK